MSALNPPRFLSLIISSFEVCLVLFLVDRNNIAVSPSDFEDVLRRLLEKCLELVCIGVGCWACLRTI